MKNINIYVYFKPRDQWGGRVTQDDIREVTRDHIICREATIILETRDTDGSEDDHDMPSFFKKQFINFYWCTVGLKC